ncbi:unnamed protein product [Gadus morhua 'NCC']
MEGSQSQFVRLHSLHCSVVGVGLGVTGYLTIRHGCVPVRGGGRNHREHREMTALRKRHVEAGPELLLTAAPTESRTAALTASLSERRGFKTLGALKAEPCSGPALKQPDSKWL